MVDVNEIDFSEEEKSLAQYEADLCAAMSVEDNESNDEETDDEEEGVFHHVSFN